MLTKLFKLFIFFNYLKLFLCDGFRCNQLLNGDALYSLESLASTNDYIYRSKNYTFYFNFCVLASKKCKNESAYIVAFPLDDFQNEIPDQCFRLSSDSIISNYAYSLLNSNDASQGVNLSYTNGDLKEVEKKNQSFSSTFEIKCVKSEVLDKFNVTDIQIDPLKVTIIGESQAGCPVVELSAIYNWIVSSQYVLAILMLLVGGIECFYGLFLLGPSLFVIGFLTGFGLLLIFFAEFVIKPDSGSGLIWFILILCLAVGGGLGYLATSLPKIGFFGLGIWLGVIIAFVLNNLVLYLSESNVLLYLLMVTFGAIGAVLARWKWKIVCVLSTSIIGGYMAIRALSIFIGGYPDELTVAKKIQYKELDGVGWAFYVYFVFMLGLSIAGMIFQFRNMRKGGKYNGEFGMEGDDEELDKKFVELSLLSKRKK